MKFAKTFWSVNYRAWGADHPYTAWFDDRDKAVMFARHDYTDGVKAHRYTNPVSIAEAGKRVLESCIPY